MAASRIKVLGHVQQITNAGVCVQVRAVDGIKTPCIDDMWFPRAQMWCGRYRGPTTGKKLGFSVPLWLAEAKELPHSLTPPPCGHTKGFQVADGAILCLECAAEPAPECSWCGKAPVWREANTGRLYCDKHAQKFQAQFEQALQEYEVDRENLSGSGAAIKYKPPARPSFVKHK